MEARDRARVAVELLQDISAEDLQTLSDVMLIAARDYLSGIKDSIIAIEHPLDARQKEIFNIIVPMFDVIPSRLFKSSET